eukprot:3698755-Rhodomonas_salina.3
MGIRVPATQTVLRMHGHTCTRDTDCGTKSWVYLYQGQAGAARLQRVRPPRPRRGQRPGAGTTPASIFGGRARAIMAVTFACIENGGGMHGEWRWRCVQ